MGHGEKTRINAEYIMLNTDIKNVFLYEEIDSTNAECKRLYNKGFTSCAAFAVRQTSGKGRMGRNFNSPQGGLYMSFTLKPDDPMLITAKAAVSVSKAAGRYAGNKIKWPNDIYLNGKKLCGILAEGIYSTEAHNFEYIIMGIGINVFSDKYGLSDDFASLEQYTSESIDINLLAKDIINGLTKSDKFDLDYYKSHSLILGKKISVVKGNDIYTARALDINAKAHLIIESERGKEELSAGEISIRDF